LVSNLIDGSETSLRAFLDNLPGVDKVGRGSASSNVGNAKYQDNE